MKTMTCKDLGGPCGASMMASTPDEMLKNAMEHVKMAHPEMVAGIEGMSDEENKKWNDMFMKKWSMAK